MSLRLNEDLLTPLAIRAEQAAERAEAAEGNSEAARDASVAARDLALAYGSADIYATWAALAAVTGMAAGDVAQVVSSDTGTHTDPVVGGTVANAGVYRYSASPAGWQQIAQLESTRATAAAAAVGVGGRLGTLPTKTSDADAAIGWVSRGTLGDVPTASPDLTNSALRQILISNFSNPGTRVTASTVSSKMRLQSNLASIFLGCAGLGFRAFSGRTIVSTARTVTVAGTLSNVGFGFVLTTVQPTLGGATAVLNTGAVFLGIRSNGVVVALQRDGVTAASGVTLTGNSTTTWSAGQSISCRLEPTSSTAARLTFFADGVQLQTCTVTGLPSDAWIAPAVRYSGLDLVEFDNPVIAEQSAPFRRSANLDPNNAGTPIGTEANPFVTLQQAAEAVNIDSARREIDIILKGGVYRGTAQFDADRWHRINVRSTKGAGAIIRPSFALSGSVWTLVSGEVWKTPNRWLNVSGSAIGTAGLFETTSGVTQAFGRTGLVTITGRAIYTRAANNTATPSRGQYSLQTTGADAGWTYARCYDGGDPNSKTWEQPQYEYGVAAIGSSPTGWNRCDLVVTDIIVEMAQTYGLYGKLVNAELENVIVRGTASSAGFGFEFDECNLRAYGCTAEGVSADAFHSAGGVSSDTTRPLPEHHYWDCQALGVFASGDAWSNHAGHIYHLHNCRAWSSGKDGLSAIQQFSLTNFDTRDHVDSGIKLALAAGQTVPLSIVSGGKVIGNNRGVVLDHGSNNNVSASIDVDGTWFEGNVSSSLRTFASGTGISGAINARGVRVAGTTPASGHVHTGGLSINVTTGAAL